MRKHYHSAGMFVTAVGVNAKKRPAARAGLEKGAIEGYGSRRDNTAALHQESSRKDAWPSAGFGGRQHDAERE